MHQLSCSCQKYKHNISGFIGPLFTGQKVGTQFLTTILFPSSWLTMSAQMSGRALRASTMVKLRCFSTGAPRTMFEKIMSSHMVHQSETSGLVYVDRHLVHEVTSPQAFEGLRDAGRKVRRPECTLAVADHNVPTTDRSKGIEDDESRIQIETLENNTAEFGVQYFKMDDIRQGIVHIVGPEQGFTQVRGLISLLPY